MNRINLILTIVLFVSSPLAFVMGQSDKYPAISMKPFADGTRHWYGIKDKSNIINPVVHQPQYNEKEITKIADNILLFQRNNGGWPKNYDMQAILTNEQIEKLITSKAQTHTTFDNSTTYTHIEYLAHVYTITHIEKYKESCLKGLQFVLSAQYQNGGWSQYYPLEEGYSRRITYNDGAFIGIMKMLEKIITADSIFLFIESSLKQQIHNSYQKGLECILKTQIISTGRLTVWCQQHDEITLQPAWARAFEPPSICNGESADIVLFLMNIKHPTRQIITSIQSAVKWFDESKILYTRVITIQAPEQESQWRKSTTDKVIDTDSLAPSIWTRFYELETERPLFSDRNRKFLYSLAEVSRERRDGYGWYTYAPQEVLNKYPKWQKKWCSENNVLKRQ